MSDLQPFLASSAVIDWEDERILAQAAELAGDESDKVAVARACFEWVRDRIEHCSDYGRREVTCSASEVLAVGTGYCYAKSHLLAALLRANEIPTAFVYQRLSLNDHGPPHCLHGLNAAFLPDVGWYRFDARGNKPGVRAEFTPPQERLAFTSDGPGEALLPTLFPEPLPTVVERLQAYDDAFELGNNLPDWPGFRNGSD